MDRTCQSDRVAPLAQAAATVVGPPGRTLMLVGATVSMFGFLCGTVLTGPRSLFAFAQAGFGPRALAAVHPSRHTPHVAIVVYVAISLGLALSGSFESLLILTNVSGLLVYIAVAISAWELRRRDVRAHGAPFRRTGRCADPCAHMPDHRRRHRRNGELDRGRGSCRLVVVSIGAHLLSGRRICFDVDDSGSRRSKTRPTSETWTEDRGPWTEDRGPRTKDQGPRTKDQSSPVDSPASPTRASA